MSSRFSPRARHQQVHRAGAPLGQERLERRGVAERGRDEDLARDGARARVVLLREAREHLVVGRLAHRVEQEDVAAEELPVADREELDGRLVVLAGEAEQVELGPGEAGHLLALHRPFDRLDLVAQGRRPFVGLLVRRDRHLASGGP